jgi:hypothetical protein
VHARGRTWVAHLSGSIQEGAVIDRDWAREGWFRNVQLDRTYLGIEYRLAYRLHRYNFHILRADVPGFGGTSAICVNTWWNFRLMGSIKPQC